VKVESFDLQLRVDWFVYVTKIDSIYYGKYASFAHFVKEAKLIFAFI